MTTEPLSVRAYRAACRMQDNDPRMRTPRLEDFAHLDQPSVTTGQPPTAAQTAGQSGSLELLSVRAFQAAQRMSAESRTMAQPKLEDFGHLDTMRPGPHAGPPPAQPSIGQPSAAPALQPPAGQPAADFDARVRASLAASRDDHLRPSTTTPAEAKPAAASRHWGPDPRAGWMQ